jgi:hypothetical protein
MVRPAMAETAPDTGSGTAAGLSPLPAALLVLATASLLHLGLGYRPLPSIDDFAYLPPFRHLADPSLYPRDALLHSMSLHSVGWYVLYRIAQATVGLAQGFWLATLLLSVATVAGLLRLLGALAATPALLPLLALLSCASELHGVGRGQLDGLFGAGLHGQWLALVGLLFAYDGFVRGRVIRSGALLGVSALCHLSVAMHGGFVLGLAALLTPGARTRNLATLAAVSMLVALPALVPVLAHLSADAAPAWPVERIVREGYHFRLAHEYGFGLTRTGWIGAALLMLAGAGGGLLLRSSNPGAPVTRVAALALGHGLLVAAAALFYGPLAEESLLPYLLALTRTSPLLVVLAALMTVAGLAAHLQRHRDEAPFQVVVWAAVATAALMVLRLFVEWNAAHLALLALVPVVALASRTGPMGQAALAAALVVVTVTTGSRIRAADVLEASSAAEEKQLFDWVRRETPQGAVFIVPPGFQEFRWYAERSVYVDFKMFPPASLGAIAAWRQRLDDVAAPDRQARAANGWEAARQFDRCYATRNSPARIAALLLRSGADYFVWDAAGLRIPPLTGGDFTLDRRIAEVFRNARFVVYRDRGHDRHAGDEGKRGA